MKKPLSAIFTGIVAVFGAFTFYACSPKVNVAADKPITVNLNVKIDHEIRVKVDKEVESLIANDRQGIF